MKQLFSSLTILFIPAATLFGQPADSDPNVLRIDGKPQKKIVTVNNPQQDESFQFEITGINTTTFSASNTSDGTVNTFKHNQQVVISLNPSDKTKGNFQLVFYSDPKEISQAANYDSRLLTISYPISLYEAVKEKLEQTLTARKKVYIKVIQKANGYREGSLVF